jgi:hypothetical protein
VSRLKQIRDCIAGKYSWDKDEIVRFYYECCDDREWLLAQFERARELLHKARYLIDSDICGSTHAESCRDVAAFLKETNDE